MVVKGLLGKELVVRVVSLKPLNPRCQLPN